jgi:hypothetical protein
MLGFKLISKSRNGWIHRLAVTFAFHKHPWTFIAGEQKIDFFAVLAANKEKPEVALGGIGPKVAGFEKMQSGQVF